MLKECSARFIAGREQFTEARQAFEQAVRYDPQSCAYHNQLGLMLFQSDELEAAREQFQAVVDLNPEDSIGYHNLGLVAEQKKLPEALEFVRKAVKLDPLNDAAEHSLKRIEAAARDMN